MLHILFLDKHEFNKKVNPTKRQLLIAATVIFNVVNVNEICIFKFANAKYLRKKTFKINEEPENTTSKTT